MSLLDNYWERYHNWGWANDEKSEEWEARRSRFLWLKKLGLEETALIVLFGIQL